MRKYMMNMSIKARLNIVVALPCEARPFIDYYKLKKVNACKEFSVYNNSLETIFLIVSGIGKIKSAIATTYLAGLGQFDKTHTYLNIGLAGANFAKLGDVFVATKVKDIACGVTYYPSQYSAVKIPGAEIHTHNFPQTSYPKAAMVDMEASGFFQAANLLVVKEHIQVVKIISDNSELHQQELTSKKASYLIATEIKQVDGLVSALLGLSASEAKIAASVSALVECLQRWHFSVYQQHQLEELLRRWQLIVKQDPLLTLIDARNAKEVLSVLTDKLATFEYTW